MPEETTTQRVLKRIASFMFGIGALISALGIIGSVYLTISDIEYLVGVVIYSTLFFITFYGLVSTLQNMGETEE